MNFTALFAMLFPPLFDAAAAKIIHQVAGTAKGDDILKKDGAAIQAIKTVAQPYIAQQVGIQKIVMQQSVATPPDGTINLGAFIPTEIKGL